MKILGLDVATRTGWAVLNGRSWEYGTIDTNTPTAAADEPDGVRFRRLADRIRGHLHGVDFVVIEEAFSQNFRTAHVLGGLVASVLVELERLGVAYTFVGAGTLKKWAVGNGNAPKSEMVAALYSRFDELGLAPPPPDLSGDEADATWLAVYGRDELAV